MEFRDYLHDADYILQKIPGLLSFYFHRKSLVIYDVRSSIVVDALMHVPHVATYDQRVLPLLSNTTFLCSEPFSDRVLEYYQSCGLCENVKIITIGHQSEMPLIMQVLQDDDLCEQLRLEGFDQLVVYFPTKESQILADRIGAKLINTVSVSLMANDKVALKEFLLQSGLPTLPGVITSDLSIIEDYFHKPECYFFKLAHGISGYGFYDNKHNILEELQSGIAGQKIIIETRIDLLASPSVQFFISEEEGLILGMTDQILEDGKHYNGNTYPSAWSEGDVAYRIINQSIQVLEYIHGLGYRGFGGIDFMIDRAHNAYVAEVNARFTGATSPLLVNTILTGNLMRPWKFILSENENCDLETTLYDNKHNAFPICVSGYERRKKYQYLSRNN